MAVTQEFKDAVEARNVDLVRRILKNSLVVDPTAVDFGQLLNYAQAMPGLFDVHDGEPLKEDPALWTKAYMDEQMVEVVDNFSKKRVEHLKSICKHLYRDKAEAIKEERRKESASGGPFIENQKQVGTKVALVGAGVTAAGVIAVTGIAAPIIIVTGVLTVGVGIALAVTADGDSTR